MFPWFYFLCLSCLKFYLQVYVRLMSTFTFTDVLTYTYNAHDVQNNFLLYLCCRHINLLSLCCWNICLICLCNPIIYLLYLCFPYIYLLCLCYPYIFYLCKCCLDIFFYIYGFLTFIWYIYVVLILLVINKLCVCCIYYIAFFFKSTYIKVV